MKCDNCDKMATMHLTEVGSRNTTGTRPEEKNNMRRERHLCVQCASESEGVAANVPMNELLTKFVLAHAGLGPDENRPGKADPQ